jgi:hypothetical protein
MQKIEKKSTEPVKDKETSIPVLRKSGYSGQTPKQIISRHIRDKNDVITEEDFIYLDISNDNSGDSSHRRLEIPDDHERPKDEDKDPSVITPWDVIV